MSKFSVQLIDDMDTRVIRVREPVSARDLIGIFERQMEAQVTQNLIWDFAPGVLEGLDTGELKTYMGTRRSNIERRRGGKTVFIAQALSEVMPVKWYKTFVESLPYHNVRFYIAGSMNEALGLLASTSVERA